MLSRFDEWYSVRYGKDIQDKPIQKEKLLKNIEEESIVHGSEMSEDIESDALAYVKAKKKTSKLQQARKNERMGRYIWWQFSMILLWLSIVNSKF